MDKKTKKETQSKPGAKKAPKPKYNLWQNTGFMLRTSRKYAKSVFPLCIVLALLSAGKSVAERCGFSTSVSGEAQHIGK